MHTSFLGSLKSRKRLPDSSGPMDPWKPSCAVQLAAITMATPLPGERLGLWKPTIIEKFTRMILHWILPDKSHFYRKALSEDIIGTNEQI